MTKWTIPDRIWADFDFEEFTEFEPEGTPEVEYIRKDIYDKLRHQQENQAKTIRYLIREGNKHE